MNLHTTGIIIEREYLNKVKKKSFLITTFLVPLLFAAICILPSVIMMATKEDAKRIAVVDNSGIVLQYLEDTETIDYVDYTGFDTDSLKNHLEDLGLGGVLVVSDLDKIARTVTADVFSNKPLGIDMTENMNNRINAAVENYRISTYEIEGLESIMKEVKAKVNLHSYTLDKEGKETISESGVYMMVSMILGMIIYMFIALFGSMVMSSVIEEKASRVVEVLVSSVKATELMFGKIIGIALVALTQFLLWVVLSVGIIGIAGVALGGKLMPENGADTSEIVANMTAGVNMTPEQMEAMNSLVDNAESEGGALSVIVSTLSNLPIGEILVCFVIFFVFGYMLYASLFAAIGSAVENEGDTNQLSIPVTIPLMLGFFLAIYAFRAPESSIVFWGSMIPFTSPIVMLARLPFGVPGWEIALSIVILIASFALCAWFSAKVYKVGILMFGKKSTWGDLIRWFKQK